jgi:sugar lactone lactonase YvrE
MEIIAVSDERCELGEGPVWDQADQALYWVDGLAPSLFRLDHASGATKRWDLPARTVGSLAVRQAGGLILAMEQGFHVFDPDTGSLELLAAPMAGRDDLRFNDGKVDRAGRFLAGGMNRDYLHATKPGGSMFRLDTDRTVATLLDGFVCFNGPCFSPDGGTLYVTGRDMKVIEAFDYDTATGTVSRGRELIGDINPDGATVDAEGHIWSAQWDDQCILRISPKGEISARLDIPGQVVTSLTFGGPQLDIIFATTATQGDPYAVSSDAGRTVALHDTGFKGLAEPRFRG